MPSQTHHNANTHFWWKGIQHPLNTLLRKANYDPGQQLQYINFVKDNLLTHLGPKPGPDGAPFFDSFCNDDFSPVELSWNVQPSTSSSVPGLRSTIRIGIEPIGHDAGTDYDRFNKFQTDHLIHTLLGQGYAVDTQLWTQLSELLWIKEQDAREILPKLSHNEHITTSTVSFDFDGDFTRKVYFYPIAQALSHDITPQDMVFRTIRCLGLETDGPLNAIESFCAGYENESGSMLRVECLSFDAVPPQNSRIKVYVRTESTALDRIKYIYTLGGQLKGPEVDSGVELIKIFWATVLDRDDTASSIELAYCNHRTAGIIFNFEIRHGYPYLRPKVYIPVRHYCMNDGSLARRLVRFFTTLGPSWQHLADTYMSTFEEAFPSRSVHDTIGRHSYIGLSYTPSGPYVTMYYNTMIFSSGRERDAQDKLIGPARWKQRHYFERMSLASVSEVDDDESEL